MESSIRIYKVKQELSENDLSMISAAGKDDICFFRFIGGNSSETDKLAEQLRRLKTKGVLLIGIFRFPFRFEGKKRLQTAIVQYYRMKELCDAITYLNSDGIMETLNPGTSVQEANLIIDSLEEAPIQAIEATIQVPGDMNIDVQDIQAFINGVKGPLYVRTFEGDTFDEPLKYAIATPYLPPDFADGEQMIVNIGYTKNVDMAAFQQINLRLNDLFDNAELFKLGTYAIDEPGHKFSITLIIKGISDPFPQPQTKASFVAQSQWIKRKWAELNTKFTAKNNRPACDVKAKAAINEGTAMTSKELSTIN